MIEHVTHGSWLDPVGTSGREWRMKRTTNYYNFPYVTEIQQCFGTYRARVVSSTRHFAAKRHRSPAMPPTVAHYQHWRDKENIVPSLREAAIVTTTPLDGSWHAWDSRPVQVNTG